MTKKHFVELANEMAYCKPVNGSTHPSHLFGTALAQWEAGCRAIVQVCRNANPAFDHHRFIDACNKPYKQLR